MRTFVCSACRRPRAATCAAPVQVVAALRLIASCLEQRSVHHEVPLPTRMGHAQAICTAHAQHVLRVDGPIARSPAVPQTQASTRSTTCSEVGACVEVLQRSELMQRLLLVACGRSAACRQAAIMHHEELARVVDMQASLKGVPPSLRRPIMRAEPDADPTQCQMCAHTSTPRPISASAAPEPQRPTNADAFRCVQAERISIETGSREALALQPWRPLEVLRCTLENWRSWR